MSSTPTNVHPSALPRYHGVSTRLKTLPSDLVHSILSDLTILQILEILIVHSHPTLDTAVTTHPQLRPILSPSQEHFQNIKQTFGLYFDIIRSKRKPDSHPDIPNLKKDARTLGLGVATWGAPREVNVLVEIQTAITKELEVFVQYFDVLNDYTPSGDPIEDRELWDLDDVSTLRVLWMNIHDAERTLNAKKAGQLNRIADLVSQNPLLLLPSTSESQEPSWNVKHRVDMFRQAAERMGKPQLHCSRIMSTHIFGGEGRLPVLPYDRTLRVLLKVFKKFPLEPERNILTGKPMKPLVFEWPEDVRKDWEKVIEGMGYVYTKNGRYPTKEELEKEEEEEKKKKEAKEGDDEDDEEKPKQGLRRARLIVDDDEDGVAPTTKTTFIKPPLRTKFTPYSDWRFRLVSGTNQPCFVGRVIDRQVKKVDAIEPLDEKEFEWLDAYLRVCKFVGGGGVSRDGVQTEWREGVSVQEYWRVHAEGFKGQ